MKRLVVGLVLVACGAQVMKKMTEIEQAYGECMTKVMNLGATP